MDTELRQKFHTALDKVINFLEMAGFFETPSMDPLPNHPASPKLKTVPMKKRQKSKSEPEPKKQTKSEQAYNLFKKGKTNDEIAQIMQTSENAVYQLILYYKKTHEKESKTDQQAKGDQKNEILEETPKNKKVSKIWDVSKFHSKIEKGEII